MLDQQRDVVRCIFGLEVFCPIEARFPESDGSVYSEHSPVHSSWGQEFVSNSGTLASIMQNTSSTKFNDDISLLISPMY